jgi:hypothetical protein
MNFRNSAPEYSCDRLHHLSNQDLLKAVRMPHSFQTERNRSSKCLGD